jgi:hypothetical protein
VSTAAPRTSCRPCGGGVSLSAGVSGAVSSSSPRANFLERRKVEVRRNLIPRCWVDRPRRGEGDSPARPQALYRRVLMYTSPNAAQASLQKKPRERVAPPQTAQDRRRGISLSDGYYVLVYADTTDHTGAAGRGLRASDRSYEARIHPPRLHNIGNSLENPSVEYMGPTRGRETLARRGASG